MAAFDKAVRTLVAAHEAEINTMKQEIERLEAEHQKQCNTMALELLAAREEAQNYKNLFAKTKAYLERYTKSSGKRSLDEDPRESSPAKKRRISMIAKESEPWSSPIVSVEKEKHVIVLEDDEEEQESNEIEIDCDETFVDDAKLMNLVVEMEKESHESNASEGPASPHSSAHHAPSSTHVRRDTREQHVRQLTRIAHDRALHSNPHSSSPQKATLPSISIFRDQQPRTPPGFWTVDSQ